MDTLHATIEEFAADGYTHVECYCPRCRMIRLRPISWLPLISMGLTPSSGMKRHFTRVVFPLRLSGWRNDVGIAA